jgi:hypothetical protein
MNLHFAYETIIFFFPIAGKHEKHRNLKNDERYSVPQKIHTL